MAWRVWIVPQPSVEDAVGWVLGCLAPTAHSMESVGRTTAI